MNAHTRFLPGLFVASLLFGGGVMPAAESPAEARVRVVRAPAWSQGDAVKEGAIEFMILIEAARIGREQCKGGLVGVGDRRGLFGPGAEQAMQQAALRGVPVVKLAVGGRVLPAPHGLFLDGSGLSEQEACSVLARCLDKYGTPPPVSENAAAPELERLRAHLQRYQDEFTLAAGTRLAVR
jgi:hypothetical protein